MPSFGTDEPVADGLIRSQKDTSRTGEKPGIGRTMTALSIGLPIIAMAWSLYFGGWNPIPATILLASVMLGVWQGTRFVRQLRRGPNEHSPSES